MVSTCHEGGRGVLVVRPSGGRGECWSEMMRVKSLITLVGVVWCVATEVGVGVGGVYGIYVRSMNERRRFVVLMGWRGC